MPLSYKNLLETITTRGSVSKKSLRTAKYIQGYAKDNAIEALANSLDINKGTVRQVFGLEDKKNDDYDPYHTSDAKPEEFWLNAEGENLKASEIQSLHDQNTDTFKRSLYSNDNKDFWHEDPFVPAFEIYFDEDSAFFKGNENMDEVIEQKNCLKTFIQQYETVSSDYTNRFEIWNEFKNVFFKIFEKDLKSNENRNIRNKSYYITKIGGLNNLNKKIINYGEDKITITMNEDVSMIAWYLSELYNNIIYSYKNQRYMFPENAIRFDMTIKINDMRNYQMPESNNESSDTNIVDKKYTQNKIIKNVISPKSEIIYTLHDCTFNFFESRNYDDELEIGGYGTTQSYTPKTVSFEIYYKSVTRTSSFPLIEESYSIDAWNKSSQGTKQEYYKNLDRIKDYKTPEKKGYLDQLLGKAAQTVSNLGLNYLDNLENKLRNVRGSAVNGLLSQFRDFANINKIEPDNVYDPDFNNRTSVKNLAKSIGSGLLNDLEDTVRDAANF